MTVYTVGSPGLGLQARPELIGDLMGIHRGLVFSD